MIPDLSLTFCVSWIAASVIVACFLRLRELESIVSRNQSLATDGLSIMKRIESRTESLLKDLDEARDDIRRLQKQVERAESEIELERKAAAVAKAQWAKMVREDPRITPLTSDLRIKLLRIGENRRHIDIPVLDPNPRVKAFNLRHLGIRRLEWSVQAQITDEPISTAVPVEFYVEDIVEQFRVALLATWRGKNFSYIDELVAAKAGEAR